MAGTGCGAAWQRGPGRSSRCLRPRAPRCPRPGLPPRTRCRAVGSRETQFIQELRPQGAEFVRPLSDCQ
ncbi:hypothetical protein STTU_0350 [Streptomyces sp. Tu6071]|nr:hypothetical protein STTU_0350 [Streptomyces sp. Tu6071]